MSTPKILVRGIEKSFGDRKILDGVDLEVMPGESVVVIGLSGTGKSVLIKCILGLLRPDAGHILVDGEDWSTLRYDEQLLRMRRIGMLFQFAALFDSMPVWKNVSFALLQQGMGVKEARTRAGEVLDLVGLPNIEDKMPAELSGGMAKRVGLARAICHKPEIIFYDEPLTGLDPVMADVITRLMQRLHSEFKVTSLTIAHSMMLARSFGDRIAMLYQGKNLKQMTPNELDSCQDPIIRQFVEGRSEGPINLQDING